MFRVDCFGNCFNKVSKLCKNKSTLLPIKNYFRTGENLVKVDLCDFEKTEEIVESFKPSCIVHCAAQRFPDKVGKDIEGTVKLNVEATKNLSILACNRTSCFIILLFNNLSFYS